VRYLRQAGSRARRLLDDPALRQDPGIENILCALHSGRRFLSGNFAEIVFDSVRDRIGAVAKSALRNLSLTVGPTPGVLLCLPIIEDVDVICLSRVSSAAPMASVA
jgi:hypothetical protein